MTKKILLTGLLLLQASSSFAKGDFDFGFGLFYGAESQDDTCTVEEYPLLEKSDDVLVNFEDNGNLNYRFKLEKVGCNDKYKVQISYYTGPNERHYFKLDITDKEEMVNLKNHLKNLQAIASAAKEVIKLKFDKTIPSGVSNLENDVDPSLISVYSVNKTTGQKSSISDDVATLADLLK